MSLPAKSARSAPRSLARLSGSFPAINPSAAVLANPCGDVAVMLRLIRLDEQVQTARQRQLVRLRNLANRLRRAAPFARGERPAYSQIGR